MRGGERGEKDDVVMREKKKEDDKEMEKEGWIAERGEEEKDRDRGQERPWEWRER